MSPLEALVAYAIYAAHDVDLSRTAGSEAHGNLRVVSVQDAGLDVIAGDEYNVRVILGKVAIPIDKGNHNLLSLLHLNPEFSRGIVKAPATDLNPDGPIVCLLRRGITPRESGNSQER